MEKRGHDPGLASACGVHVSRCGEELRNDRDFVGVVLAIYRPSVDADEVAARRGIRAQGGAIIAPDVQNDRISGQIGEPDIFLIFPWRC